MAYPHPYYSPRILGSDVTATFANTSPELNHATSIITRKVDENTIKISDESSELNRFEHHVNDNIDKIGKHVSEQTNHINSLSDNDNVIRSAIYSIQNEISRDHDDMIAFVKDRAELITSLIHDVQKLKSFNLNNVQLANKVAALRTSSRVVNSFGNLLESVPFIGDAMGNIPHAISTGLDVAASVVETKEFNEMANTLKEVWRTLKGTSEGVKRLDDLLTGDEKDVNDVIKKISDRRDHMKHMVVLPFIHAKEGHVTTTKCEVSLPLTQYSGYGEDSATLPTDVYFKMSDSVYHCEITVQIRSGTPYSNVYVYVKYLNAFKRVIYEPAAPPPMTDMVTKEVRCNVSGPQFFRFLGEGRGLLAKYNLNEASHMLISFVSDRELPPALCGKRGTIMHDDSTSSLKFIEGIEKIYHDEDSRTLEVRNDNAEGTHRGNEVARFMNEVPDGVFTMCPPPQKMRSVHNGRRFFISQPDGFSRCKVEVVLYFDSFLKGDNWYYTNWNKDGRRNVVRRSLRTSFVRMFDTRGSINVFTNASRCVALLYNCRKE